MHTHFIRRRWILPVLFACLVFLSAGCTPVYSRKIVGSRPPPDLKAFEGDWKTDDGEDVSKSDKQSVVQIKIADETAGELTLSGLDDDNKPKSTNVFVRTLGKRIFISVGAQEKDDKADLYTFMLLAARGTNSLVAVVPRGEAFARLVDAKQLRGSTELDGEKKLKSVTVDELSEEECDKLFTGPNMDSFDWEHPLVYVRGSLR